MVSAVFLTGGTGFVGGELLKRLAADRGVERIFALCRARDEVDLRRRAREALFKVHARVPQDREQEIAARVEWCRGDMTARHRNIR